MTTYIIQGREVIVEYICPPIPVRSMDYAAYFADDAGEEDAPCAYGKTADEAIQMLFDMYVEEPLEDAKWK